MLRVVFGIQVSIAQQHCHQSNLPQAHTLASWKANFTNTNYYFKPFAAVQIIAMTLCVQVASYVDVSLVADP